MTISTAEGAPLRRDGRLAAPDRPGLGISARPEVLGRALVEVS